MSKSIYDEALNLIENIGRNLPYTWLVGRDNLMKIKQALEQAQKQEKLLELYKELIIELDLELEEFKRFGDKAKNPALDKLRIKNETFVFEGNASSLFKQIKELEDDL